MQSIEISVFGDSHLASNHFFQSFFSQQMLSKSTKRFCYNINYFAKGGAQINRESIDQAKHKMSQKSGLPHITIIGYGGNNIRRNQSGVEIIQGIEEILSAGREHSKHHLVILGMIPDPEHLELDERFNTVDKEIRRLVQQFQQSFVNLNRILRTTLPTLQGGAVIRIINTEYFNQRGERYDIHLNQNGAEVVANEVAKMVSLIPKGTFGLGK